MLLDTFGHCGKQSLPSNGLLPILVGPPADSCPTVAAMNPEIAELAAMVPTPMWPGTLSDFPKHVLPRHLRDLVIVAQGWLDEWKNRSAPQEVADG